VCVFTLSERRVRTETSTESEMKKIFIPNSDDVGVVESGKYDGSS